MKKSKIILLIIALLVLLSLTVGNIAIGTFSTKEINPKWIEIKRKKYPFRHWQYSGIFPAGHFIDDPHISSMDFKPWDDARFEFDDEIKNILGDQNTHYQAYDVNTWFRKLYRETLIAVESNGNIFEYRVESEDTEGVFVNNFDSVFPSFLMGDSIIFLSSFDITKPSSDSIYDRIKPRFISIKLPLKNSQTLKTIAPESEEGQKIISYLHQTKRYKKFKQDLCKTSKSIIMIKFYEQFEPCGK